MLFVSQMTFSGQSQETLSVDFLEFLAEMDEVIGDGFENWLEDDSEDESGSENGISFKDEQISGKNNNE